MKLQPVATKREPTYPSRVLDRAPRGAKWKRAAAVVGASLALWLPACGTQPDIDSRLAGAEEPVRLAGDEAPINSPDIHTPKPPLYPTIDPEPIRSAGDVVTPTPPAPPPPLNPAPVRLPGRVPVTLPPPTSPPGNGGAAHPKPPIVVTPPPPEHPRLAGVPRRVER